MCFGQVHGQVSPAHDAAAAQAVVDLVKKAKAELGIDADIDEELVRICTVSPKSLVNQIIGWAGEKNCQDRLIRVGAFGFNLRRHCRTGSRQSGNQAHDGVGLRSDACISAVPLQLIAKYIFFIQNFMDADLHCIYIFRLATSIIQYISSLTWTSPRSCRTLLRCLSRNSALLPADTTHKSQSWAERFRCDCWYMHPAKSSFVWFERSY